MAEGSKVSPLDSYIIESVTVTGIRTGVVSRVNIELRWSAGCLLGGKPG
jgi:hypothetical protein